jgi:hypothetical protein
MLRFRTNNALRSFRSLGVGAATAIQQPCLKEVAGLVASLHSDAL